MHPTHRLVAGSTGFVAASVVGLPLVVDAGAGLVAAATSSLPDDLENLLHLPHRKITHYPAVQVAVVGLLAYLAVTYAVAPVAVVYGLATAVEVGCLTHSLADAATVDPRGIRLLWPIRRRGYHLLPRSWRVRVGTRSTSELVFSIVWSAVVLSYLYARFRHQIPA